MDRRWQVCLGLGLFLHHYTSDHRVDPLLSLVDRQDKKSNVQRGGDQIVYNLFAGHGL